jgi:hypothetical protein
MTEYSTTACAELEDKVTRFAYETEISQQDRRRVEEHMKACPTCGELVFFIQKTRDLARKTPIRFEQASESCPDADTIVALEEGTLDRDLSRKLGVHLLHCKQCREAYLLLRSLSEERFEEKVLERFDTHAARWPEWLARVKTFVVDLSKTYGPGAMLGAIRIAAERPAFAVAPARGEKAAEPVSKVLELNLGGNVYGIELGLREDGSITCDIAGYETPQEKPAHVAVVSENGELFSTETDRHGNAHFALEKQVISRGIHVLTLQLDGDEREVPFSLPQPASP